MAKKEPQPQLQLFTQLHFASIEKITSRFLSPFVGVGARTSLIFSIHDTEWIAWYVFSEGDFPSTFNDLLAAEGNTLSSDNGFGRGSGGWGFRLNKPRSVSDFRLGAAGAHDGAPRARLQIQSLAPTQLKVSMTVYLADGPETLTWHSIATHPGTRPKDSPSHLWGHVGFLAIEEFGVGMSRGFSRFRIPSKHRTQVQ